MAKEKIKKVKVINSKLTENLSGSYFNDTPSNTIFSFGSFFVTSNFSNKENIEYKNSLSSFTRPVTLESIGVTDVQSKIMLDYTTNAVLNLDKSDLNTFVRYGSAYEFMRVSVQNIILAYPGSIFANSKKTRGGNTTYVGFEYNEIRNISTFYMPISSNNIDNIFGLVFNDGNTAIPDNNRIKNLNESFLDYVVWSELDPSNSFKLIGYTGNTINSSGFYDSGNTISTNNYVKIQTMGNPFHIMSGITSASIDYHIRPNNQIFEEFRAQLSSYEKNIISYRDKSNGFSFTLKVPTLLEDGKIIYSDTEILWSTGDGYNIDINTSQYRKFLQSVLGIGAKYDEIKTDLIARFLTPSSLKMYDLTNEGKITKLLRLYGNEFDQVRQFIDSLVNINKVTYDKINNIPDQIVKNMARTLGWDYFSLVNEDDMMSGFLTIDDTERDLNETILPADIDIELWRRIINNTSYFWKSKGTRHAIKSMFMMIGIPEPFININEYIYTVDGKIDPNSVKLSIRDFPSNSLPYDNSGYPIAPLETNDFYFQLNGNIDSGQEYLDVFRMAGFKLNQIPDNKKTWVEAGSVIRSHNSTPQYYQEDSRLVINTKEIDVSLDTSRGVEYSVFDYIKNKDFKYNSTGYTMPYSYLNIMTTGIVNVFTIPVSPNQILGDFEVRYNGILLNAPSISGATSGSTASLEAEYSITGNTFTIPKLSGGTRQGDVIQVTLIESGTTNQAVSGISVQYIVTRVDANSNGTYISLPSYPRGDVQLTINGIALTKGTGQFNADYSIDLANSSVTGNTNRIIIHNNDVKNHLNEYPNVQISYMQVHNSDNINLKNELIRIDSFNSGKIYYNNSANKYVYRLNYKANNASEIKVLVDGIALEPLTDYNINPQNAYEVFLPKGLRYGTVISIYYIVGDQGAFDAIIDDSFGVGDISELSFLEFMELVHRKMINARTRKTITNFKGGWYPTLLRIYEDYLNRATLPTGDTLHSNGYSFANLYPFLSKYNTFFQRFVDQLLPSTIIIKSGGILIKNSTFTQQKHWYKRGVNLFSKNSTNTDMRGNPMLQYIGNDGARFQIQQIVTAPVTETPSIKTLEGVEEQFEFYGFHLSRIKNTGGFDIVGYESIFKYGMEYRIGGTGSFNSTTPSSGPLSVNYYDGVIDGLEPEKTYEYRAYMIINSVTYYGEIRTITTQSPPLETPSLKTKIGVEEQYELNGINYSRLKNTGGFDIVRYDDITQYGMRYRKGTSGAWNYTTPINGHPAVNNYSVTINNLELETLYEYQANISVSGIIYYGDIKTITTSAVQQLIPTVYTGAIDNITISSMTLIDNEVISDGNSPITEYGIIYTQKSAYGNQNLNMINYPTHVKKVVSTSNIANPWNIGITGLTMNTMTYARAYATNSVGTGYGTIKTSLTKNMLAKVGFTLSGNIARINIIDANPTQTFKVYLSYYMSATCDNEYPVGAGNPNQATTYIEVSIDGGITWSQIDSVSTITIFDDIGSDTKSDFGGFSITGVTSANAGQFRFRGHIDYAGDRSSKNGEFDIEIETIDTNIGAAEAGNNNVFNGLNLNRWLATNHN